MKELSEIEHIRPEVEKCASCGLCLYYCPVYAQDRNEDYVSRGRNRLMKEIGDRHKDLVAAVKDRFSKCLLCRRCTMNCPQGVRTDLITMAARAELVKGNGLSLTKKVAFRKLLKDRRNMRRAVRAAYKLQGLLPVTQKPQASIRHLPFEAGGKLRHFPLFFLDPTKGRQLPSIAKTFLGEQVPEVSPAAAEVERRNLRVAYFCGCATEFSFPEVGKGLIQILNQLGVEVVFPAEQGCCGIAVLANGDFKTAREMALYNLHILSQLEVDLIVTGCATCGSTLKEGWASNLARGEAEKAQFEALGARVRDISELLVHLAGFQPLRYRSRLPENTRVTYHDPCHLRNYQGVLEQPRKLLKQAFGDSFIEMDNNGCCGCGGTFNLYHYDLSKKIARNKIDSIARTKADVVINTCPGCMIQLIDNIERYHLPQRIVHIVEAIEPLPDL